MSGLAVKGEIVRLSPVDAGGQVMIVPYLEDAMAAVDVSMPLTVLTWNGDYRLTDWSAVKGRRVVVWEANDIDEAIRCSEVAGLCRAAGAQAVKIVPRPGSDRPWGWSLKDAVEEGWQADDLIAYAKSNAVEWTIAHHADLIIERDKPDAAAVAAELARRGL
jgi:hypothetical protein